MRRATRAAGVVTLVSTMLGLMAPAAMAAPPNDSEATAIEVSSLPFTYEQDTAGADADGPRFCSNNTSVFFTFTPSDTARVQVDTFGSDYDTVLSVYTRDGELERIRCNDDRLNVASGVRFRAVAGTTYYLMIAECCGSGRDGDGGNLVLNVTTVTDVSLEATLEVSASGTYDPIGGSATLSGTLACSGTAIVGVEGVLRQVRDEIYLARGYPYHWEICRQGAPVAWTEEVDSETAYAFGAGAARLTYSAWASDGFSGWALIADSEKLTVTLASG